MSFGLYQGIFHDLDLVREFLRVSGLDFAITYSTYSFQIFSYSWQNDTGLGGG